MKLLMSIAYFAVIGILAHYVGQSLPRSLFCEDKFPYKPFLWENNGNVYHIIGIKKWKAKVPDMSRVMKDMLPKRVTFDMSSKNLTALIKETCVAEFVHDLLFLFFIGIYFIWKSHMGTFLVTLCFACNLPFILIQRYNRPHLIALRQRIEKREGKLNSAVIDPVV